MIKVKKIGECKGISIKTGIMTSRIIAKEGDEVVENRYIITPSDFADDGYILNKRSYFNDKGSQKVPLKVKVKPSKLTKAGDLIIKLCGPYDCAMIDNKTEGYVVSSFCATISCDDEIDRNYLMAFLNSEFCKRQIRKQIEGKHISTAISVSMIKNVDILIPDMEIQQHIGKEYLTLSATITNLNKSIYREKEHYKRIFRELLFVNSSNNRKEE